MNFRDFSIGNKMIVACMVTSIAAVLLTTTLMITSDQIHFRRTQEQEIRVLADIIANHSQAALLFGDINVANENLKSLSARDAIITACIYLFEQGSASLESAPARLFSHYHREDSRWPECPDFMTLKSSVSEKGMAYSNDYFEIVRPVALESKPIGSVMIRTASIDAATRFRENILIAGVVVMLAGLSALLIALRLEKLIFKPLHKLDETARKIVRNANYSLRAEKYGNDEIGTLVDSFNRMLLHIEQEDAVLRESEERFRLFSASASVGIFQTDMNGHCKYANRRLAEFAHTNEAQIVRDGWMSLVHPEDKDPTGIAWQQTLRTNVPMALNCRFLSCASDITWITGSIDPLTSNNGQPIGFLGTLSDISELKNAQLQLEHLAFYDMLTGLANRRLFRNRIEHILALRIRNKYEMAILLIDIDHFKHTNDTLGHDSGDALLREVAVRLSNCVRSADTVARLGGDEFCVILENVRDAHSVSKIAETILRELRKPIYLGDHEIIATASMGIALSHDVANPDAELLIKHADLALYRSKGEGRNCFRFYVEEMNTSLVEHLQLVRDFREALQGAEFLLHYQPQFQLSDGSITGFEALVRWLSPKRGFVSPLDFIPVAEESGLIIELGHWILLRACEDMKALIDDQLVAESSVMTVNLSIKQLQEENFVDSIKHVLSATGLFPHQLGLEITESMLMENIGRVLRNIEDIQKLGVQFAIDDFGTGYSSLSYLKKLPVHTIKVDRSFVRDIPVDEDDMEITAAVIAMAHKLNYKVVAEGIETPEQQKFLNGCHCDFGQGYLYSKPVAIRELRDFCRQQKDLKSNRAQVKI